ncbi:Hpt domain-containing protein [Nocardioides dongxiaopingii]|uniref:Hpt domain-containing protein n=1 Tax=Nocardioides dongxiaopingii TaxID=2576036 RepID=UPI0010C76467|nr:Hpt domain-containing protein [Nocardioides dongxiaopingii]
MISWARTTTPFDPATLHLLVDDVREQPFVLDLVGTYRSMLRPRVTRVVDAVLAADLECAMDAVLSLKVSSTMTGAQELAEMAGVVETHLRRDELADARAEALLLPPAATRAEEAITRYVVSVRGAGAARPAQGTGDSIR